MSSSIRPRRSVLYMPGANASALEKAKTLPADALILDLEDAVAPEAKVEARDLVCCAGESRRLWPARDHHPRQWPGNAEWGKDDLKAAAHAKPHGILAPKVNGGADDALARRGADGSRRRRASTALWVMIETPLAILNLNEIAAAAKTTRLAGFVMGSERPAQGFPRRSDAGPREPAAGCTLAVLAARALRPRRVRRRLQRHRQRGGFTAECGQAKAFGFDGKTLIHPSQVEPCNTIFAPPADG